MHEPVELVEDVPTEAGRAIILRSPSDAAQVVLANDDKSSLAIVERLPRTRLDADQIQTLKANLVIASVPVDPNAVRFSDEQIRNRKPTSWMDRAMGRRP